MRISLGKQNLYSDTLSEINEVVDLFHLITARRDMHTYHACIRSDYFLRLVIHIYADYLKLRDLITHVDTQ